MNDSTVPSTIDPTLKYLKRPRHKTKPDKYDYKGNLDLKTATRRSHAARKKRIKGAPMPIEDFRAENIDTERVTLKRAPNLGIFSKSRTSVPLVGRDLPDLTFPTMKFLTKRAEDIDNRRVALLMQNQARVEKEAYQKAQKNGKTIGEPDIDRLHSSQQVYKNRSRHPDYSFTPQTRHSNPRSNHGHESKQENRASL